MTSRRADAALMALAGSLGWDSNDAETEPTAEKARQLFTTWLADSVEGRAADAAAVLAQVSSLLYAADLVGRVHDDDDEMCALCGCTVEAASEGTEAKVVIPIHTGYEYLFPGATAPDVAALHQRCSAVIQTIVIYDRQVTTNRSEAAVVLDDSVPTVIDELLDVALDNGIALNHAHNAEAREMFTPAVERYKEHLSQRLQATYIVELAQVRAAIDDALENGEEPAQCALYALVALGSTLRHRDDAVNALDSILKELMDKGVLSLDFVPVELSQAIAQRLSDQGYVRA